MTLLLTFLIALVVLALILYAIDLIPLERRMQGQHIDGAQPRAKPVSSPASHRPSLPNRTRGFLFGVSGGILSA